MKKLIAIIVTFLVVGGVAYALMNKPSESALVTGESRTGISPSEYVLNLPVGFSVKTQTEHVLELNGEYIYDPRFVEDFKDANPVYHFDLYAKDAGLSLEEWVEKNWKMLGYRQSPFYDNSAPGCEDDYGGCSFKKCSAQASDSSSTRLYICASGYAYYFLVNQEGSRVITINFGQDPPATEEQLIQMISFGQ